jgi:hypothetical protein
VNQRSAERKKRQKEIKEKILGRKREYRKK